MTTKISFCIVLSLLAFNKLAAQDASKNVIVENEFLRVTVAGNEFSIQTLPSGKTVVASGKLDGAQGDARKTTITDKTFGKGKAIEMAGKNGIAGKIMVFPNLPFALICKSVENLNAGPVVLNRISVATMDVKLNKPAAELKSLGTGGLLAADKNKGSYAWLAVAEPQSRNGIVAGWLTGERGSGVLFSKIKNDSVILEARCDYGKWFLVGQSSETETLAIGYFDDARLGLESWADAVAKVYNIKLKPVPSGFCTWYCEKHGKASDEKSLADLTDFAAEKNLKSFGFSFIQIDDGWQLGEKKNGPKKNFTSYNSAGPYKAGMKATADYIKSKGFTPGIWFMPFAGTYNDPWFEAHQDWFAKREDGKPYDNSWGGTSLDMTNPAAREYVSDIAKRIAKDWGYTYFKLDGLYTGMAAKAVYVNDGYKEDEFGDAVFMNPDKTNYEVYRSGLKLVREAAGPDVFILGCNTAQTMRTYQASFGLVDAMRVGPDNSGTWKRWMKSPVYGSRHYFLNGRIWWNDPDPNYERASLSADEARAIASWACISGGLNSNSDWIPDLPADRIEILKRTLSNHNAAARPVDLFENDPPRIWLVSKTAAGTRRDVITLFNWDDKETQFDVPMEHLGLPAAKQYVAFDYWKNAFIPSLKDILKTTLAPHSCQIIGVRPLLDRPVVVSTSLHVTQGIIDLTDEKWENNSLSGKSRVVGGDAYELRIFAPIGKAFTAEINAEDKAAGADIKVNQSGNEVRVIITSPSSRVVEWKVTFING